MMNPVRNRPSRKLSAPRAKPDRAVPQSLPGEGDGKLPEPAEGADRRTPPADGTN
jgi:hypothetical protein